MSQERAIEDHVQDPGRLPQPKSFGFRGLGV